LQARTARSWVIFCVAVWLTGTVAMAVVATQNFYTIDRLLQARPNPAFAADIDKMGHDATRELLRYLSSELNRLYFQYWNIASLAVGLLSLWLVVKVPGAHKPKWGIVSMLGIVLFLTVLITPFILSVGRSIDFVPRDPPPPGLRTFGLLHATYTVFDGVELILGILVTTWMVSLSDAAHEIAYRPDQHQEHRAGD
jgi:hypothetical protein